MKNTSRQFRPTTNWLTTAVLAVTVSAFGLFAQTQASETDLDLATIGKSFSDHALSGLDGSLGLGGCDLKQELRQTKEPIVLLYR